MMIVEMNLRQRIIAWLLWKLNGWGGVDDAKFECLLHPEFSTMAVLCRSRWYSEQAKKVRGEK